MRRLLLTLGSFTLAVVAVASARGLLLRPAAVPAPAPFVAATVTADSLAALLSQAIRFATIAPPAGDSTLRAFDAWIATAFPATHATLQVSSLPGGGLLYEWRGRDESLPPLVLLGHRDVVPARAAEWSLPPFGGVIRDGFVWGRGALDDKARVVAMLSAIEARVAVGGRPARTLYLALGHDEERGGSGGAAALAATLSRRGVRPLLVLDEGLPVASGLVPGVSRAVALVGTAEKGLVDLELVAQGTGGHASMPAGPTAVERLATALERIGTHPLPATLTPPVAGMLDALAPGMPFPRRVVIANRDWLGSLLARALARTPAGNATVRTTVAATTVQGGSAVNMLPHEARAELNARLLPGTRLRDLVAHLERVVDDTLVSVRARQGWEPGPVSPAGGAAWTVLVASIGAAFPGVPVAPALLVGASDARHYVALGGPVYRFTPLPMGPSDVARLHGPDERVALTDLHRAAGFYATLLALVLD